MIVVTIIHADGAGGLPREEQSGGEQHEKHENERNGPFHRTSFRPLFSNLRASAGRTFTFSFSAAIRENPERIPFPAAVPFLADTVTL
jgi:hypothetical protein